MLCHTRNFEDVMIQRALADVAQGCYVDVGASVPEGDSNTFALYQKGWRGLCVEPLDYQPLWAQSRPQDIFINAAVGSEAGRMTLHVYPQAQQISTGSADTLAHWQRHQVQPGSTREVAVHTLSRLIDTHLAGRPIHLLSIDVEGMERDVLLGLDLRRHRPWLMVIEAVKPGMPEASHQGWEPLVLDAGYGMAYFDGVNRFYLAHEQRHLLGRFALPPNVWDGIEFASHVALQAQVKGLRAQLAAAARPA
jgi:FkbM family methyltransferase